MPKCFASIHGFRSQKKWVQSVLLIVPIALAAAGATLGFALHNNKDEPKKIVNVETSKVNRRIYLISTDNLAIPLSVQMEKKATRQEELIDVFEMMREDSKIASASIKGFIPKETKLRSIEIVGTELIIDVSKEFLDYANISERRIIESMTYTFTQFEEVSNINIFVDGKYLKKLPKKNTDIPGYLSTSIGINIEEKDVASIDHNTINLYYEKEYDKRLYLVPVSTIVDKKLTPEGKLASAARSEINAEYGLKKSTLYEGISSIQGDTDPLKVSIELTDKALLEEGIVKRELFDLVSLTLSEYGNKLPVTFVIEKEELAVDGIMNFEDYVVSELIFNEVKL